MIVRDLLTKWGVQVDDRALNTLNKKIKTTKERFDRVGKTATRFGAGMSLFVTTPLLGAAGAMIKLASDAEETRNKFNEIFKDIAPAARETAKSIADSFGLSVSSAEDLLAKTGDLLVGLDMNQQGAFDLSTEILKLSQDLASFKNVAGGAPRVVDAITKSLLGEREMLKTTIGTSVQETEVRQKANELRAQGIKGTERQIKALATLRIIQERNTAAIGDFARTQGGFANQFRIFQEVLKDVAITFGEVLLPTANMVLKEFIIPFLRYVRDMNEDLKFFIVVIGGVVAAIGPLLIVFGAMASGLSAIISAAQILLPILVGINLATLGIAALWLAAAAAIFLVAEDIIAFFQGRDSVTGILVEKFGQVVDFIMEKFKMIPAYIAGIFQSVIASVGQSISSLQGMITGGLGSLLGGSVSAFLGIGGEAMGPAPTPMMAAAGPASNQEVTVNTNVTVPPNTPPSLVGDAVEKGIRKSMDEALRQTRESTQPQVEY